MMVWWCAEAGDIVVDSGFYRPQFFKSWTVRDFLASDQASPWPA